MAEWVNSNADPQDYWSFDEKKYDWIVSELLTLNLELKEAPKYYDIEAQNELNPSSLVGDALESDAAREATRLKTLAKGPATAIFENENESTIDDPIESTIEDSGLDNNTSSTSDVKNDETGEIESSPPPVITGNDALFTDVGLVASHKKENNKSLYETANKPSESLNDNEHAEEEQARDERLDEYLTEYYMDDLYEAEETTAKVKRIKTISYDREFLLSLRYAIGSDASTCIPEELLWDGQGEDSPNQPDHDPKKDKQNPPQRRVKVIKLERALDAEVQLKTCNDAWRPKKSAIDASVDETALTVKKFRSILNKITPEKFEKLMGQINELEIKTLDCLEQIIDTIFDTAVNDQTFSEIYAKICKRLEAKKAKDEGEDQREMKFRTLLLNRCQKAFMNNMNHTDETAEGELTEEEILKKKIKRLGNIRLIGELFKTEILVERIVHDCIIRLFQIDEEIALESGLLLLKIAGPKLNPAKIKPYTRTMSDWQSDEKWSSRIRFMVRDLLEREIPKWHPGEKEAIKLAPGRKIYQEDEDQRQTAEATHIERTETPPTEVRSTSAENAKLTVMAPRDSSEDRRVKVHNLNELTNREKSAENQLCWKPEVMPLIAPSEVVALSSSPKSDILPLMSILIDRNPKSSTDHVPTADDHESHHGGRPRRDSDRDRTDSSSRCHSPTIGYQRCASPVAHSSRVVVLKDENHSNASLHSREHYHPKSPMLSPARSPARGEPPSTLYHHRRDHSPSPRERLAHATVHHHPHLPGSPRISRGLHPGSSRGSPASSSPSTSYAKVRLQPLVRALEKNNAEEAREILSGFSARHHADFVFDLVNTGVELCFRTRRKIGTFLLSSIEQSLLRPGNVRCGLTRFMEITEDVEVDVPRLWFNLGQICAPLLSDDTIFPIRYLEESCQATGNAERTRACVMEIIKEATEALGKERTAEYWESSEFAQRWMPKSALKSLVT